jgi:hypothetical protein
MRSPLTNIFWVIISGLKGLQWKQALFVLALALFGQANTQNFRNIPVTLHSLLTADYSADAFYVRFPNLNIAILLDALGDRAPDKAASAYATLQSSLLTPVPTVTLMPGEITQNPPPATPTAPVAEPSATTSSTATATPSPTPSPTPPGTNQPLSTVAPTLGPTPTPTRVKSTQSGPTDTRPPQPTATATQAPPTQAATPTRKPPTPTKPPNPYPGPTKPPYP